MNPQRDNVKAGLFVLVGIVLAVSVIFILADFGALFAREQRVRVYYALNDGLQGLKPGARVNLGGQPVGEVVSIDDYTAPNVDHVEGKIVTMSIPARYRIYWTARIEVEKPPLGTNTTMNIASVGDKTLLTPELLPDGLQVLREFAVPFYDVNQDIPPQVYRLAFPERRDGLADDSPMRQLPTGTIPGQIAGTTLTKSLTQDIGIGEQQRRQIAEILTDVRVLAANLREMSGDLRKVTSTLGGKSASVGEIIDNINAATASLKKEVPEIAMQAKTTLGKADTIVEDAKLAMADVKAAVKDAREVVADVKQRSQKWLGDIDAVTTAANEGVGRLRDLIKEKSPAVSESIDNLQMITRTVKEKTLVQIESALDKANSALENVRVVTDEAKGFVIGQRPVLERFVANAQLMSAQLKLAAIEVRRSPWRLLYSPDEKELETDNLYDAARSFALAASTLDAAADSLRTMQAKDPNNAAQIKRMLDDLEKLYGKYKEAEDHFWQALKDRPQPK